MKKTLTLGLLLVASVSMAQKAPKYKIGLQLYSVRDACAQDFEGTVREVAKMGFTGVEFAGYYGRTAEQVKKMLDDNGLKCYGTHTQLGDLLGENFDKTVQFHKVIGAPIVIVPSLPHDRIATRAKIIETAGILSDIASKLKKHKLQFAFHNHAAEFQKVEGELIYTTLFNHCNKDVRIQFDTANAKSAGADAAEFFKMFPNRTVSVHVKDFSATNHDALLGEGDVKWPDVLPFWKRRGAPTWFIIEQESYPVSSLECARRCLATFHEMMGIKK